MSPVPSVASASAFALSTATPSASLAPDIGGQPASALSQHVIATSGLLFAMVAVVSVAGYFYRGRGAANSTHTNSPWLSLGGLLSSLRPQSRTTTNTTVATDRPVDLEAGFQNHVSMVYARFFHPPFWNLVEYFAATPTTPAICVEEETNENPVPEPQLPGMNSFWDMHGDDDDPNGDDATAKKPDRDKGAKVKALPPYDTSAPSSVSFSNETIGTTVRPDTFLLVPGQEAQSTVLAPPDPDPGSQSPDGHQAVCPDQDFQSSPYDGIVTTGPAANFPYSTCGGVVTADPDPVIACSCYHASISSNPDEDFHRSPYDGIIAGDADTDFTCSPYDGIATTVSESGASELPYLRGATTPPRSSSRTRRCGLADMGSFARDLKGVIPEDNHPSEPPKSRRFGLVNICQLTTMDPISSSGRWQFTDEVDISNRHIDVDDDHEKFEDFAQRRKDTIPKEGYALVATISPPAGLSDLSELAEMDPSACHEPLESLEPRVGVWDSRESAEDGSSDAEIEMAFQEGQVLIRELLAALRDPNVDCTPCSLSDDNESEYYGDDEDEETTITPLKRAQHLRDARRNLLDSTSSPGTDSDVSTEGSIYPLTPRSNSAPFLPGAPYLAMVHPTRTCPVTVNLNEEVLVLSPPLSSSPVMFPTKALVRCHRDNRSLLYGPRVPLVNLPRL